MRETIERHGVVVEHKGFKIGDDVNLEVRHEKEMNYRRDDVIALHSKVERYQEKCNEERIELANRIANLEGKLEK